MIKPIKITKTQHHRNLIFTLKNKIKRDIEKRKKNPFSIRLISSTEFDFLFCEKKWTENEIKDLGDSPHFEQKFVSLFDKILAFSLFTFISTLSIYHLEKFENIGSIMGILFLPVLLLIVNIVLFFDNSSLVIDETGIRIKNKFKVKEQYLWSTISYACFKTYVTSKGRRNEVLNLLLTNNKTKYIAMARFNKRKVGLIIYHYMQKKD